MPDSSYRLEMSGAEASSFTLMHPEAAEALFAMAAARQQEHHGSWFGSRMREAVDGQFRQSVHDARAVNAVARAVQPSQSAREKAVAVQNKLASREINMKPQATFGVKLAAAQWNAFAHSHPEAAKSLFQTAASHLPNTKPQGVRHQVNMAFDGAYRQKVQDADAIRAMATVLGKTAQARAQQAAPPQKAARMTTAQGTHARTHRIPQIQQKTRARGMSL